MTAGANGRALLLRNKLEEGCKPLNHVKCTHWDFSAEKVNLLCRAQCDRWLIAICKQCSTLRTVIDCNINIEILRLKNQQHWPRKHAGSVTLQTNPCYTPFSCWKRVEKNTAVKNMEVTILEKAWEEWFHHITGMRWSLVDNHGMWHKVVQSRVLVKYSTIELTDGNSNTSKVTDWLPSQHTW
jgi:hypothetical protein